MKINVYIAIASHLSDAQELIALDQPIRANKEINYAKAILFKHPDTNKEVDSEELDIICKKVDDNFK